MDKPIPEAVVTDKLIADLLPAALIFAENEEHLDHARQRAKTILLETLTAAQQQGQEGGGEVYQWRRFANRWEDMTQEQYDEVQAKGEIVIGDEIITPSMTRKLYTAPPSAPVVVDHIGALRSVLCDPYGAVCIAGSDGDRAIVQAALDALAQHPAAVDEALSHADMCRLSRVFNAHNVPGLDQDRRINEWLGKRIAAALAAQHGGT